MANGKYDLSWYTYTDHLREMLHNMMSQSDFTDITIVCEDKKEYKAHKVVLAACSPIFQSMFCTVNNRNEILYLKGIKGSEFEAILQYIYLGHAEFSQEGLNEFLKTAITLEIKEISRNFPVNKEQTKIKNTDFCEIRAELDNELNLPTPTEIKNGIAGKIKFVSNDSNLSGEYLVQSEKKINYNENDGEGESKDNISTEDKNSMEPSQADTQADAYASKFTCHQCGNCYTQASSLKVHVNSKHEGVRVSC